MFTKIISLTGVQYEGDARRFSVKTESGEITILPHHRPLVSVLVAGTAVLEDAAGAIQNFPITGGFLQMNGNNELTVLVD